MDTCFEVLSKIYFALGNRANFYRDQGKTSQALSDYGRRINLKPNDPEPYNSVARLYFNFNNRDSLLKALHNYNKAIEFDPSNVEYMVNRGATYAKLGDGQNAINNLNQAESIDPSFANIYLNRSVIFNQSGDMNNALLDINKYLELKPYFPDMWYEKARIHNIKSQHAEAIAALDKAISMNTRNGLYYFERAKSHFTIHQIPQAKQDLATSQSLGHKGNPSIISQISNAK